MNVLEFIKNRKQYFDSRRKHEQAIALWNEAKAADQSAHLSNEAAEQALEKAWQAFNMELEAADIIAGDASNHHNYVFILCSAAGMARQLGDFETALRVIFVAALNNPPNDQKEGLQAEMQEILAALFPHNMEGSANTAPVAQEVAATAASQAAEPQVTEVVPQDARPAVESPVSMPEVSAAAAPAPETATEADALFKSTDGLISEIDAEEMPAGAEACAAT